MRRRVDVLQQRAAADLRGARARGRPRCPSGRERSITSPSSTLPRPGAVVAAAADGDVEPLVAAEVDRRDDVVDVRAARDQRRALVDHRVVERPCLVVVRVVRDGPGCRGGLRRSCRCRRGSGRCRKTSRSSRDWVARLYCRPCAASRLVRLTRGTVRRDRRRGRPGRLDGRLPPRRGGREGAAARPPALPARQAVRRRPDLPRRSPAARLRRPGRRGRRRPLRARPPLREAVRAERGGAARPDDTAPEARRAPGRAGGRRAGPTSATASG